MTVYYRFCDYASGDGASIYLQNLPIIRKTAKGAWVDDYGRERFVLDGEGRRYCYPTQDAAWSSFKIRKMRQRQHLKAALDRLTLVDELTKKPWAEAVVAPVFTLGVYGLSELRA